MPIELSYIPHIEVTACGISIRLIAVPVFILKEPTKARKAVWQYQYMLTGATEETVLAIEDLNVSEPHYMDTTEDEIEPRLKEMGTLLEHAILMVESVALSIHREPTPAEFLTIFISMLQKHGFPFTHRHMRPFLLHKIRKVVQ